MKGGGSEVGEKTRTTIALAHIHIYFADFAELNQNQPSSLVLLQYLMKRVVNT